MDGRCVKGSVVVGRISPCKDLAPDSSKDERRLLRREKIQVECESVQSETEMVGTGVS
jgi:hypothetical protein